MLISLTVGKVDAGVAVLLTEDKRLVTNSYNPSLLSQLSYPLRQTTTRLSIETNYQALLDRIPLNPPPSLHLLW